MDTKERALPFQNPQPPARHVDINPGVSDGNDSNNGIVEADDAMTTRKSIIPIRAGGESGRQGIHPIQFVSILWNSSSRLARAVNVLWPVVPAALAAFYSLNGYHTLKFSLAYVAMVPCANMIGFAGQEFAEKLPHVFGVLVETTVGSLVEIILFLVLLLTPNNANKYYIIRAAILGSILATMLLCLGACFFAAGLKRESAEFDSAISEVGTGLLLMAGLGLAIPTIFQHSITLSDYGITQDDLDYRTTQISRVVAILLLVSYIVFVIFQTRTHHGIYDAIFQQDEHRGTDRSKKETKARLTLTECILALAISVTLVTLIALALVREITPLVEESGISDPFMGLILVPLVEKAAEHLTALDEAYDNQLNFALSHCIGATIQTAMFNAPLVVIVAWGKGLPLDLSFEVFEISILIISIITVGNYLRDQKSDYLEGFLCIITYVAIAVAAFYFPNKLESESVEGSSVEMVRKLLT
ncbi:hypothetical protein F5Y16DRAFT_361435 [Xylariaceae sp. FL0255]|nr:hypothetical protein F5Y16DRAFT_361435 [Xylariaceae sp. FL0255]